MTSEPACLIDHINGGTREDAIAAAFPSNLVRYDVIIECEDALASLSAAANACTLAGAVLDKVKLARFPSGKNALSFRLSKVSHADCLSVADALLASGAASTVKIEQLLLLDRDVDI